MSWDLIFRLNRDYELLVLRLSQQITLNRATRSMDEVGRQMDHPTVSQMVYPIMQMADIAMLGVDAAVGGIDQRKIHMLAREHLINFGYRATVCIHTPILNGLDGKKMSSSQGNYISIADTEEDIRKKCQKAFCPPEIPENPVLQIFQFHIFPRLSEITIKRPEKFGGDRIFMDYKDLNYPMAWVRYTRLISRNPAEIHLLRYLNLCGNLLAEVEIPDDFRWFSVSLEKKLDQFDKRLEEMGVRIKDTDQLKVSEDVFDDVTLLALYKLVHKKWLSVIGGSISTGKEANVFYGERDGTGVAIKIYRIRTANFTTMSSYIIGDRRFSRVKKSRKELVFAWTRKEFSNLARAWEAGIPVPEPIVWDRNILIMSYLGKDEIPYPS